MTLDANTLGHMVDEKLFHLEAERDEARLELDVTKKLYRQALDDLEAAVIVYKAERKVTEKRGRHVAALREALGWALAYAGPAVEGSEDYKPVREKLAQARAALTDTTKAAARYRLVDDEHVVVPVEPTEKMLKLYDGTGIIPPRNTRALAVCLWKAMLAAAPAAKGEAGEGTEPEGK